MAAQDMVRILVSDHLDNHIGDIDAAQVAELTDVAQVNGEHALTIVTTQELEKTNRLLIRDARGYWHEYVVLSIESERDDGELVWHEYYCVWSMQYDLEGTFIDNQFGCGVRPGKSSLPQPARRGLECALEGTTRWVIGTISVTVEASASFYRRSGWEGLQTVVERWGGELHATITVDSQGVVSRAVDLLEHEGRGTAVRRFDYGFDVTGIKRTVSDDIWPCRIVPLGASQETEAGGYTRRPSIESVNDGVMWLQDDDAVPLTRVPDGTGGWEYPTLIVKNDTYEEPADLKAWALEHISDYTRPIVSYEATVAQFSQAGMDAHGVGLGDEIVVVDRTFGSEGLRLTARVLKVKQSLLDPADTELTIGNLTPSLSGEFASLGRQVDALGESVATVWQYGGGTAWVQNLLDRINADINATGGYTYITEGQGIRTYDVAVTDPLVGAEASAVCEIKGGTMRIANTKDSGGQWEWKTVFTSGRILAELIDAIGASSGYHAQLTASGLDVYDGSTLLAHFGEQAAFYDGDGQPLITVKAYSDNHEGMVDFGSDVGYISGSYHEYAAYSWTDMIVQATTLLALRGPTVGVSASGLDTDVYGTSTESAAASVTAQRAWTSNPNNLDLAGMSANVYDTGNSPDASLYAHSASSVASVKATASASHATVNLACDRLTLTDSIADPLGETGIYPTHGSLAQDTNVAAGGSVTRSISFGHTYAAAPTVVATLYSTSSDAGIGKLSVVVTEITYSGAKVKIFNNDSQTRAPGVRWMALG